MLERKINFISPPPLSPSNGGNRNCLQINRNVVFQARSLYGLKYGYDYLFAPTCDTEITDTIEIQGMMISNEDNGTEFLNLAKELDVLLYPNPSKTSINLTAENIVSFQLTIVDQQGRIIPFEKEIKHKNLVQIQHSLDKGFYTILIDDGQQKIIKKLFVE
ncbi:MAG: T9SS type A sorting domain-containing protein [Flavobacteriia bacterium]|nr:T9SS type A sorting domain-containing protein [Flavobacteriia bacterium]